MSQDTPSSGSNPTNQSVSNDSPGLSSGLGTNNARRKDRKNRNNRKNQGSEEERKSADDEKTIVVGYPMVKRFTTPSEGATKKGFDDNIENLQNTILSMGTWDSAVDVAKIFDTFELPSFEVPEEPPSGTAASKFELLLYEQECLEYIDRVKAFKENSPRLYSLLWQLCSTALKSTVQEREEYYDNKENPAWLLTVIRDVVHKKDLKLPRDLVIDNVLEELIRYRQTEGQSVAEYVKSWTSLVKVYEASGGTYGYSEAFAKELQELVDDDESSRSKEESTAYHKRNLRERMIAMGLIKRADPKRYRALQIDLRNDFALGTSKYPSTIQGAIKILNTFRPTTSTVHNGTTLLQGNAKAGAPGGPPPGQPTTPNANGSRAAFDGSTNLSFTCTDCGRPGHKNYMCPDRIAGAGAGTNGAGSRNVTGNQGGEAATGRSTTGGRSQVSPTFSFVLSMSNGEFLIDPAWILLDSQSTDDIFSNSALVSNIRLHPDGDCLESHTNGGIHICEYVADFGDKVVWFNPSSLTNVLSLRNMAKTHRVTLDTAVEGCFHVHTSKNSSIRFARCEGSHAGLHYFDSSKTNKLAEFVNSLPISNDTSRFPLSNDSNSHFLQTVADNKIKYNARELAQADKAYLLSEALLHPSPSAFSTLIAKSEIRNLPITVADAKRSADIYGSRVHMKGRTTRKSPRHVPDTLPVDLPVSLLEEYKHVTACCDLFFVNRIPVFLGVARRIDYLWVHFPTSRDKSELLNCYNRFKRRIEARGFTIRDLHADTEFECLRYDVLPVILTCPPRNGHVPEAERGVRYIKEGIRTTLHGLPYTTFPKAFTKGIIRAVILFANAFTKAHNGISDTLTPRNIIDALPHIDYNHLKYSLGSCVEVAVDADVTNTMNQRTISAIVLDPTANGGYRFMSLETGHEISGRIRGKVPVCNDVIDRVNTLGRQQRQRPKTQHGFLFEWRPGLLVDPGDNEPEMLIQDDPADDAASESSVEDDDLSVTSSSSGSSSETEHDDVMSVSSSSTNEDEEVEDPIIVLDDAELSFDQEEDQSIDESEASQTDEDDVDEPPEPVVRTEERLRRSVHFAEPDPSSHGRGQRDRVPNSKYTLMHVTPNHRHVKTAVQLYQRGTKKPLARTVTSFVFNQMSARKGIKKHGRVAELALLKEFKQLINMETLEPKKVEDLTMDQIGDAIEMVNLIKEKRGHTPEDPNLKGRACGNGSKEKGKYSKAETYSPTVNQDALMMSLIVDALEQRDVAFSDVTGAYLHATMDEFVLMVIRGDEARLMAELVPEWKEFLVGEGKNLRMYVRLNKALYGCVRSALLWYNLYSTTLKDMGFVLNPYDPCVANAIFDGKQCTICWYVDDNKISHVDPAVVTKVVKQIEAKFGKMNVTRDGDDHDFLGMNISFQKKDRTVKINMKQHALNALSNFLEDVTKTAATPATRFLFDVREDSPKLDERRKVNFHSVTMQLLYIAKRCRLDILTTVSFLSTRMKNPDEDDWGKLRRCLQFLKGTIDDPLILGGKDIHKLQAWIDASYSVHCDRRSHTGGTMSWGRGCTLPTSSKQKLNTKSSTEAEVIGLSDYLNNVIWARMFIEGQGYEVSDTVIYQDNESAMKLAINGRMSSGKLTRHIDNRYFWIKDRLKSDNMRIEHCRTHLMIADFFTKPLQGALFKRLRAVILGHETIEWLAEDMINSNNNIGADVSTNSSPPSLKRVGNNRQNDNNRIDSVENTCSIKTYKEALTGMDDVHENGNDADK